MRYRFIPLLLVILCCLCLIGCGAPGQPDLIWGRRGAQKGDFVRPRAAAIDSKDRLYIVDFTARIQIYDRDGMYLGPTWTTPDYRRGRPSGLSIDSDDNLLVSDSHYHCVRIYNSQGKLLRTFGEEGVTPGKLGYISDVIRHPNGHYYIAEFGDVQRISRFDQNGTFIQCWGSAGQEPGQFSRPRALAIGPGGLLYVADACNHRIQVFTPEGKLVRIFGQPGSAPGDLRYPYDLAFGPNGNLYIVEFGNHRVQQMTPDGQSIGCWGGPGRKPGQLHSPWALVVDSEGDVHVVDTENHRVQRLHF